VTVQFPQIDSNEPRLLTDNHNQSQSDHSFEDKLKLEQARLGLLFSPFNQLESIFSSFQSLNFNSNNSGSDLNGSLNDQASKYQLPEPTAKFGSSADAARQPQVFDSAPSQTLARHSLQEIISRSEWFAPNLSAQPLFYQAFLEGKLQPKLDLQSLIDEIVQQVKIVKEKGKTEISLSINPEELGEILLTITSVSGMISIQIQTSKETKKLLESERAELERSLKKAKVNLGQIRIEEVIKYA
jgi:flagellar hook-length control protein FliK